MVQIGNFHVGRAETVEQPRLHSGEAFLMWDYLVSRYDFIQTIQLFQNFVHDAEFKLMLSQRMQITMEQQNYEVEQQMNKFQLGLPHRPPISVNLKTDIQIFEDEFMFRIVLTEVQSFLDQYIRTIRSMTTNDSLRKMFMKFMKDELKFFGILCKYGKVKGWLAIPPQQ